MVKFLGQTVKPSNGFRFLSRYTMALQCANISGYTYNCASVKRGYGARITALLRSQYTLLTEETLNKKCPVNSVLNVLQL